MWVELVYLPVKAGLNIYDSIYCKGLFSRLQKENGSENFSGNSRTFPERSKSYIPIQLSYTAPRVKYK